MINFCSSKGVFCTSATDYGSCCAAACMKKPDFVEVLSFGDVKIIGSDGREYVPVVRCKDCFNFRNGRCYSDNFTLRFEEVKPDWFCADGVRKEQSDG